MRRPGRGQYSGRRRRGPLDHRPGLVPRWLRLLPLALVVGLAVVQFLAPNLSQIDFLYAALPPLTSLIYGPVRTALLAVAVLLLLIPDLPPTAAHINAADLTAVALIGLFSVLISTIRSRYVRDLIVVRDVAEAVQRAVLPPLPARVGHVHCTGLYRAAQVGALVGGDLYDVRVGPYGVRALVGDVQGHGLAAVGTVAAMLGAFREAVLDEPELRGVAGRLDRRLLVDREAGLPQARVGGDADRGARPGGEPGAAPAAGGGTEGQAGRAGQAGETAGVRGGGQAGAVRAAELFATALLMEFAPAGPESAAGAGQTRDGGARGGRAGASPRGDGEGRAGRGTGGAQARAGTLRLVACGHPLPLLLRDGGVRELVVDPSPPLGLNLPGGPEPKETTVSLLPGDVILGYTDGVTEARNAEGAFYPLAERIAQRLREGEWQRKPVAPAALVDFVWRDLTEFTGRIEDDVALLSLSVPA